MIVKISDVYEKIDDLQELQEKYEDIIYNIKEGLPVKHIQSKREIKTNSTITTRSKAKTNNLSPTKYTYDNSSVLLFDKNNSDNNDFDIRDHVMKQFAISSSSITTKAKKQNDHCPKIKIISNVQKI